jgi:hypothetical protein
VTRELENATLEAASAIIGRALAEATAACSTRRCSPVSPAMPITASCLRAAVSLTSTREHRTA